VIRSTIPAFGLTAFASLLFLQTAHSASLDEVGTEVLASREMGHIFLIRKGQGNKMIKEFDANLGQKIRLVGFDSMSLDQLKSELKIDGPDAVLDIGDHSQLRIVSAGPNVVSSIQIELDRSQLISTFVDDFDTLSLNLEGSSKPGTWRTNFGYGGLNNFTLANNGELQVYVDPQFAGTKPTSLNINPFQIRDGKLDIVARPLTDDERQAAWGRSYSSGLLTSRGTFAQTYGLFEIRARTPKGKGLWPAFWLLPVNKSWPPELDVLEILGDNPQKLYVSWHSKADETHTSLTKAIDVPDSSEDFHTYSVYWTKDSLEWFFDDVQIACNPTPRDFNQPMYLLINLAVGGGWPGAPDKFTRFPAKYTIDWVRAYARKDSK
jgi:beta-glucanase (GH16 family)